MSPKIRVIKSAANVELSSLRAGNHDLIVISADGGGELDNSQSTSMRRQLLDQSARVLAENGWLCVYGEPQDLSAWGKHLSEVQGGSWRWLFKYWIALDIRDARGDETLASSHLGLLVFIKTTVRKRVQAQFRPDVESVRIPHLNCAACGKTLKDWGGKRHLMNPRGAVISDVWRHLPRRIIRDHVIPADVLEKVQALAASRAGLHIIEQAVTQQAPMRLVHDNSGTTDFQLVGESSCRPLKLRTVSADSIFQGDCISFLQRVAELHPNGLFDLAFADPPYNLAKLYGSYADEVAEQKYLNWCNEWLQSMARALKPGGSLFVLNLPKWAIHHAAFLSQHLDFRHWIAWDALSDPRGKIMPAHYALLWYSKPGAPPQCRYVGLNSTANPDADFVRPPDSPKYCLRASCIRDRKARGDDEKVELTDVWFDIHRIKHKRDRDAHPCQLPEKLMERIIRLTTNPGDWVFDPFCGAGTTAIVAKRLGRRFVLTEIDERYVRLTREKLEMLQPDNNGRGELFLPRESVIRPRPSAPKREIELYLQELARKLGRVPDDTDVAADDTGMLQKIDAVYAYRSAAFKRAKVALAKSGPAV